MKQERIYTAIGAVDEDLLNRCDAAGKHNKNIHWRRWGVLAACACLVIIGGFIVNNIVNNSYLKNTIAEGKMGVTADSIYATPEPGTWSYTVEVEAALEEYAGQDVKYLLRFDINSDSDSNCVPTSGNSDEIEKELERLNSLGYDVGYVETWTYGYGLILEDKEEQEYEKVYHNVAAGYFTAEQLESFPASSDYGYFFDFITNGDGSPVDEQQGIITEYSIGGTTENGLQFWQGLNT